MVSEAETHQLIAGNFSLDFANTVNGHAKENPHEYVKNYSDLLLWSHHAGILSRAETTILAKAAKQHPGRAAKAFARALAMREAIFRVFAARAHGSKTHPADLKLLNAVRSQALAHSQIALTRGGFAWAWTDATALDRVLWPIALSAADLLTSGQLARVRACAGHGCDWLFVDNSRNHLRRWCSMEECGNRAKAKRFLERKRHRNPRQVLPRQSGSSAHS